MKAFVVEVWFVFVFFNLVGDIRKACEAVGSFLILSPNDPDQIKNKEFFASIDNVEEEFFTPRKVR